MNLYTLVGLIALIAVGVTLVFGFAVKKPKNWGVNYLRNFLGVFFIFSGVVKAIDPVGTSIKLEEYFTVFTEYMPFLSSFWEFWAGLSLEVSIFTIVLEIALGISLLLGTLPITTIALYTGLILFFTALTGFSAYTGKVTDCGCFGDFVKLKPIESFYKDIFLTVLIGLLIGFRNYIKPIVNMKVANGMLVGLTLASLFFCLRNYYDLPIVDFRAYHVGQDLISGRQDGTDGKIVKHFTLKKSDTGEIKELTDDEYMAQRIWEDKSWVIQKELTKDKVIEEPKLPTIKDFFLFDESGTEVTDSILGIKGYNFFVAAYSAEKASDSGFSVINNTLKDAAANGVSAIGLTASDITKANQKTDGIYTFYNLDATPIKTMVRGNPSLVLIKDGVVAAKWHNNSVPPFAEISQEFGIGK